MNKKIKKKLVTLDDYSGYGNDVLYRMCKKAPKHTDIDQIVGKIWIIGRSYSASIERKAGSKMQDGVNFYSEHVAPLIKKSKIDKWIESVSSIRRLNDENIKLSLLAHKNLTDLFNDITGINKRSLASKYLHFHCPRAFFIYDSIANRNVRKSLSDLLKAPPKKNKDKPTYKSYDGYDNEYSKFVSRCLFYRDNYLETEIGGLATPRKLDMDLLGY